MFTILIFLAHRTPSQRTSSASAHTGVSKYELNKMMRPK